MRLALILCSLLACACQRSFGLEGDAIAEPGAEAVFDWIGDPGVDAAVEPSLDPPPDGTTACLARSDEEMRIDFLLDGGGYDEYNLTLVCTAVEFAVDPDMGRTELWLSCRSDEGLLEEHHLFFYTYPHATIDGDMFMEDELIVRYVADPIFWTNRWMTIHSVTVGLLLAAVDAETVVPRDPDTWYEPLIVGLVSGVCPVEEGFCGGWERQALEVGFWDAHESVTVFDGNVKPLEDPDDSYEVMVSVAHDYHMAYCDDVADTWVQALIHRLPEE